MSDRFYDYTMFSNERVKQVFTGWDGLGGYHGLLLKKCASLVDRSINPSILDVGCGLCHLYELLKEDVSEYVGVDNNSRVLQMASERYPALELKNRVVYDIHLNRLFNYVFAIGLYSDKPKRRGGIDEMLRHTKGKMVLTYWKDSEGIKLFDYNITEVIHDIDPRLVIVEITV